MMRLPGPRRAGSAAVRANEPTSGAADKPPGQSHSDSMISTP
jgi:hypothetical protein